MHDLENRQALTSNAELEDALKIVASQEQIYSIALFDILGFSNFVESDGTQVILDLYNKLLDLINKQKSTFNGSTNIASSVVPFPVSTDWKSNRYIADGNGYINVCHFSDTFIIYVNYNCCKSSFWLADKKDEPYPLLL